MDLIKAESLLSLKAFYGMAKLTNKEQGNLTWNRAL
jgi:hypothetical protein